MSSTVEPLFQVVLLTLQTCISRKHATKFISLSLPTEMLPYSSYCIERFSNAHTPATAPYLPGNRPKSPFLPERSSGFISANERHGLHTRHIEGTDLSNVDVQDITIGSCC
jgi:hypothetical protein